MDQDKDDCWWILALGWIVLIGLGSMTGFTVLAFIYAYLIS